MERDKEYIGELVGMDLSSSPFLWFEMDGEKQSMQCCVIDLSNEKSSEDPVQPIVTIRDSAIEN